MVRPLLAWIAIFALAGCKPSSSDGVAEAPKAPECRRFFRIATDQTLSLEAFSQLALSETVSMELTDKEQVTLSYRGFDYEDTPVEGEWWGVGVVYARGARAGALVAGGVIWASGSEVEMPSSGGADLERRADGLYLTVTPVGAYETPMRCRGGYVVKLDRNGALYADGLKVEFTR